MLTLALTLSRLLLDTIVGALPPPVGTPLFADDGVTVLLADDGVTQLLED